MMPKLFPEFFLNIIIPIIFFFRNSIKTSTESEWSWNKITNVSAQLKTHLAVHGGGRQWSRNKLFGKHMFNFEFTVMRELDYKE